MPAQAVQFVPALGRLGAKFADGGGRGLPDGAEPALEIEARQPFLVGAELVQQRAVRRVLLRLHALDDRVLDVVQGERFRSRLLAGAAFGPGLGEPQIAGELVGVQRREDVQRHAIVVLLPLEAIHEATER